MMQRRFFGTQVIDALMRRGVPRSSATIVSQVLKSTTPSLDERLQLASTLPLSAIQQLEKTYHPPKESELDSCLKFQVLNEGGREYSVKGKHGESLQDLVSRGTILKEYLECACGGNMTCSTCHVYIVFPPELGNAVSEEEEDMLDIAFEPKEGVSRLGCQLKLHTGQDLIVQIPKVAYNHYK